MADHEYSIPTISNRKRATIALGFSAATFVVAFVLGGGITAVLGPGTSGIVTVVFTTIVMVIGARIIGTFPAFLLMVPIFTFLSWPTNIFGPPGPHKIAIGFLVGLTYDVCWVFTAKSLGHYFAPFRKYQTIIAAPVATAVSILAIAWLLSLLSHPRAEYLAGLILYLVPVYAVLGLVGSVIGDKLYESRFKDLSITKQLQSEYRVSGSATDDTGSPDEGEHDA